MAEQANNSQDNNGNAFVMQMLKENGRDIKDFQNEDGSPKIPEVVAPATPDVPKPPKTPGAPPVPPVPGANPPEGEQPAAEPDAEDTDDDIEDEKLLAVLRKRGLKIDKLDDLKPAEKQLTEEEQQAAKKELRENALKYALNNKLITADELKNYNIDSDKSPRDIVLKQFTDKWRETEKDLSDEDAEERFAAYMKESLPEDNWERKELSSINSRATASAYL